MTATTATKNGTVTTIGTAVDGALSVTMNRRRALRLLGAAGATAVLAGVARAAPVDAATAGSYRTTTDLNLRAKPSSSAKVLLVIPEGGLVEEIDSRKNGYLKCRYGGKTGWAYEAYLESTATGGPQIVGTAATNTDVNLRSGPSTGHQVLRVLAPGTEIGVSDTVEDGFRYVVHDGLAGWVWLQYIGGPIDGGDGGDGGSGVAMRTTAAVNFRSKPSISASIISVVPANTTVYGQGTGSDGFVKVKHNGKTGYIYADYLN